jgi:hypothetical protein
MHEEKCRQLGFIVYPGRLDLPAVINRSAFAEEEGLCLAVNVVKGPQAPRSCRCC